MNIKNDRHHPANKRKAENHAFILDCLLAMSGTMILTATIISAASMSAAAAAAPSFLIATAAASLAFTPIGGILLAVGLLCLLGSVPFMCHSGNSNWTTYNPNPYGRNVVVTNGYGLFDGGYGNTHYHNGGGGVFHTHDQNPNVHGHGGNPFEQGGNVHGHGGGSSNIHGHF